MESHSFAAAPNISIAESPFMTLRAKELSLARERNDDAPRRPQTQFHCISVCR